MHRVAEPAILYFGTPVVLVSSTNEDGSPNMDRERWRPLIMSFCQFFALGGMVHPSPLAEIPESMYRAPQRPSADSELPHPVPAANLPGPCERTAMELSS